MEKKMTKKMVITEMLANEVILANPAWTQYLSNELALVTKKAESKKVSETQKLNTELRELIVATLTEMAQPMTISDLQSAEPKFAECNNQKMSALLSPLVKEGTLEKTKKGKLTLYSIPCEEEEESEENSEE